MRILGIDPGLRITGYGALEISRSEVRVIEAGVIRTREKGGISERLGIIYRGISGLVTETRPDVLVLEKLFSHYKHPTTALLMGHARGVICLAAGEKGVPLVNIAPTRVKKAILSNGLASKSQVALGVSHLLGLRRPPEEVDVTDALAVALSYAMMRGGYCPSTAARMPAAKNERPVPV